MFRLQVEEDKATALSSLVELGIEADVGVVSGSNVNLQSNSGKSPLHAAARAGLSDVVEALIAASKQSCPVHAAVLLGGMNRLLVEHTIFTHSMKRKSPAIDIVRDGT